MCFSVYKAHVGGYNTIIFFLYCIPPHTLIRDFSFPLFWAYKKLLFKVHHLQSIYRKKKHFHRVHVRCRDMWSAVRTLGVMIIVLYYISYTELHVCTVWFQSTLFMSINTTFVKETQSRFFLSLTHICMHKNTYSQTTKSPLLLTNACGTEWMFQICTLDRIIQLLSMRYEWEMININLQMLLVWPTLTVTYCRVPPDNKYGVDYYN